MKRGVIRTAFAVAGITSLALVGLGTASASTGPGSPPPWTVTPMPPVITGPTFPGLPSATPMAHTPGIVGVNGLVAPYYTGQVVKRCFASAPGVGGEMFFGGWFAQAIDGATGAIVNRDSFFAADPDSGAIDPAVNLTFTGPGGGLTPDNHTLITSVECALDGHSIFIGGKFTAVNGVAQKGVVKYNLTTHTVDTTFNVNASVAGVQALTTLPSGDLVVCGAGTYAGVGKTFTGGQPYLASVSQTTGANTGYINTVISGIDSYYSPFANKCVSLDVSPTATPDPTGAGLGTVRHLLFSGAFTLVNGVSREQVGMLALTPTHPTLSSWDSDQFHVHCYYKLAVTVMAVKYSPDGLHFLTGSTGGSPKVGVCDSLAEFSTVIDKAKHNAVWVNYTGGDSYWSVDWASNSYVCGAGHERWASNPFGRQAWGTGGVPMPGITCLNASNGSVIVKYGNTWNPTRTRNVGGQALYRDGNSLWIMSDGVNLGCANPGDGIDCSKDPSVDQSLVAGCLKSDSYPACIHLASIKVNGIGRLPIMQ